MAVRLRCEMTSILDNDYKFDIYDDSYASSVIEAPMNDFKLEYLKRGDEVLTGVKTSQLTLNLIDDGTAGIETALISLLTSDEGNSKIVMYRDTGSGYVLEWAGVVMKDSVQIENTTGRVEYKIRAVCGLKRLEKIEFTDVTDGSYTTPEEFLQLMYDCLEYNNLSQFWGVNDAYFKDACEWVNNSVTTPASTDSPFLYTRVDPSNFIIKDDNKEDRPRTCLEVIEEIVERLGCRIMLSGGSYYIEQVRNHSASTRTVRSIRKALTVSGAASENTRIAGVVPSATLAADQVKALAGGFFGRKPALLQAKATVQPLKNVSGLTTDTSVVYESVAPITQEHDLGTLRGGTTNGNQLKIVVRLFQLFKYSNAASRASLDVDILVHLPISGGSDYYLKGDATTGELTWTTTSSDRVSFSIDKDNIDEFGTIFKRVFVTPIVPGNLHAASSCDIEYDVTNPGAALAQNDYQWSVSSTISVLASGEIPKDVELIVDNPTSTDNSYVLDYGHLWFNDLGILTSKNIWECYTGADWETADTWDAGFDTDTDATRTMLLEAMSLQRSPLRTYTGPFYGWARAFKSITYDSTVFVMNGMTWSGKMEEFDGEWFEVAATRSAISIDAAREYHDKPDTVYGHGTKERDRDRDTPKFADFTNLGRVGTAIANGASSQTTIDLLDTIGHANLKDDDTIILVHPLTLTVEETLTVNGDVGASDTSITVDSFTASNDIPVGTLIRHQAYGIKSADIVRGNELRLDTTGMADSSAANGTVYYSTTQSKLVWKDGSGTVHNLHA